ncbi:MAG: hypothetical protein JST16_03390 [Bdellovibrionales bacterium]|nr:hypothetical protein [Bdellovibrionales bacterium]
MDIRLEFLFEGCPRLQLETHWTAAQEEDSLKKSRQARPAAVPNVRQDFARMLASPHLRSREGIVRRFDHEVQGRTLRKPFAGRRQNSAQDGSRLETPEAGLASIVLAHGLSPQREDIVENVVHSFDEALRSAVLAGARLETAGLLDNFCWPDPITRPGSDARTHRRLWRLVRSCETLSRLCRCFDLPLVSGKDSMKNNSADFAALETLVISLGASAESRMLMPTGFFSRANEVVFWIPPEAATLRDSAWERALGVRDANSEVGLQSPSLRSQALDSLADTLRDRYQRLARAIRAGLVRGAKDISEGGLLTAVFEMCLGRDLGFHFEAWDERAQTWFGEGLGGFVFGVDPHLVRAFAELMPEAQRLGVTMNVPVLRWGVGQELALAPLVDAYDGADKGAFWS